MGEDVRIIKNKRGIESALICLLKNKDFSKITIQDICTEALISRSTFYCHYLDKYDLLEKVVNRYAYMIQQAVEKRFSQSGLLNFEEILMEISQTYLEYQDILITLFKVHVPNSDLQKQLGGILFNQCYAFLEQQNMKTIVPIELLSRLYVTNVSTLMEWIFGHGIDESTIHFANQLQLQILKLVQKQKLVIM